MKEEYLSLFEAERFIKKINRATLIANVANGRLRAWLFANYSGEYRELDRPFLVPSGSIQMDDGQHRESFSFNVNGRTDFLGRYPSFHCDRLCFLRADLLKFLKPNGKNKVASNGQSNRFARENQKIHSAVGQLILSCSGDNVLAKVIFPTGLEINASAAARHLDENRKAFKLPARGVRGFGLKNIYTKVLDRHYSLLEKQK